VLAQAGAALLLDLGGDLALPHGERIADLHHHHEADDLREESNPRNESVDLAMPTA